MTGTWNVFPALLLVVPVTMLPREVPSSNANLLPSRRLFYKTNTYDHRSCTCATTFFCTCCEFVTMSMTKSGKNLCVNLAYQNNGLNVDVSLDSEIIKMMTVTQYQPFRMCSPIPGSLFSSLCVNMLELNSFPRSLTACVQLDIFSKKQSWKIIYNCLIVSTLLPSLKVSNNRSMEAITTEGMTMPTETATTIDTTETDIMEASNSNQSETTSMAMAMP